MKKKSVIIIVILLFFFLLTTGCIKKESIPDEKSYSPYSNGQRYEATISIKIVNPEKYLNSLDVWSMKPVEWESQQNVSIINVTPIPFIDYIDPDSRNGLYKWVFTSFSKESNLTIIEKFYFTSYEISFDIDPNKIGEYNTSSKIYRDFTKSEEEFQSDHRGIIELANMTTGQEKNPYLKATKLFYKVAEYMEKEKTAGDNKGAIYALSNKKGDCGEYSALFIALCRASGIPTRPIYGFLTNNHEPHMWVEVYFEGYGWVPADPYNYDLHPTQYNFGHMPNRIFILSKGNITMQGEPLENFGRVRYWVDQKDKTNTNYNFLGDIVISCNKA